MFDYTYDPETGGLLLNDRTPVGSKEPRPVYAAELDLLHMNRFWKYEDQNDAPYMWSEAANYIYRGKIVARVRGGSLYEPPVVEMVMVDSQDGTKVPALPEGTMLIPVDIDAMVDKCADMMAVIEQITVKKIYDYYKRYKNKLDCFHVAFSGGKDSVVLEKVVEKALPHDAFMVVFGDTKMEFPDTYDLVDKMEAHCREEEIPFYRAASHLDAQDSWKAFGPPSRTIRWCCNVLKSSPQTQKIREVLGKADYVGVDFVGVRAQESLRRSEYEFENFGKKQKGQYAFYPILDWTSAEVWIYIYSRRLLINNAYKFGSTRVGCLLCPMGGDRCDYLRHIVYKDQIDKKIEVIKNSTSDDNPDTYVSKGGWAARRSGRDIDNNPQKYYDEVVENKLIITVKNPSSDWREWIKTLGDLPFQYEVNETSDGYEVSIPARYNATTEGKYFKSVFRKAAYCVGCNVCATNCQFGCISFDHGIKISNCRHCRQCHDINEGCLMYASRRKPKNGGFTMGSLCSFAGHAPKAEWVYEFFEKGNDFFENNTLGPNQFQYFKKFLAAAGLAVKNKVSSFYDLVQSIGSNSDTAWGLIYSNLAYNNAQIRWYVDNMPIGINNSRESIEEQLIAANVKKTDASFIVKGFERLCQTPLGTKLNFGTTTGAHTDILTRTKCRVRDDRVLLYALYRYAEGCDGYYEFNMTRLMDTSINSNGISPAKLFGLNRDDMEMMLGGLSAKYPEFINYTSTHGLDKISLREDKTATEVLELFNK